MKGPFKLQHNCAAGIPRLDVTFMFLLGRIHDKLSHRTAMFEESNTFKEPVFLSRLFFRVQRPPNCYEFDSPWSICSVTLSLLKLSLESKRIRIHTEISNPSEIQVIHISAQCYVVHFPP